MISLIVLFGELAAGAAEVEYAPAVSAPPVAFPWTLTDIAARLPVNTDAKDADLVTYAHEGNHFLCRGKPGFHGVYIGNGIRVFVPTPPLLTAEVFAAIPKEERGSIYETYRRQGATEYWSVQPLMLLDEWAAYTSGSITRGELKLATRQESDRYCAEMATYAWHLWTMAKALPQYNSRDLTEFCRWNEERCKLRIPGWRTMFTREFK
jgi:hypothetical protein